MGKPPLHPYPEGHWLDPPLYPTEITKTTVEQNLNELKVYATVKSKLSPDELNTIRKLSNNSFPYDSCLLDIIDDTFDIILLYFRGKILGYNIRWMGTKYSFGLQVCVASHLRGLLLGRELLGAAEKISLQSDCEQMLLEVSLNKPRLREYYQSIGFIPWNVCRKIRNTPFNLMGKYLRGYSYDDLRYTRVQELRELCNRAPSLDVADCLYHLANDLVDRREIRLKCRTIPKGIMIPNRKATVVWIEGQKFLYRFQNRFIIKFTKPVVPVLETTYSMM